jgi:transcriptional regulator with XRE-family HTH domain
MATRSPRMVCCVDARCKTREDHCVSAIRVSGMTWWKYVLKTSGEASQVEIAQRVGISPASISRWKESAPKPENVAAFARAYNRPVLEAFVAAGFLSADEAKERPAGRPTLDSFTTAELLDEVTKRVLAQSREASTQIEAMLSKQGIELTEEMRATLNSPIRDLVSGSPRGSGPVDGNIPLPPDYYDLAAHPQVDSPSMREHANGLDRGEESQDPDDHL